MKKRIEIDSFLEFQYVSDPRFSRDGKMAAFIVTKADALANTYFSDLWLLNLETKQKYKLTNYGDVRLYTWTNDDNILFRTGEGKDKADGNTCFYKIYLKTGTVKKAFSMQVPVFDLRELANGGYLIYGAYDSRKGTDARTNKNYEVMEETPFWFNDYGFIEGRRRALYFYDAAVGALTKLTSDKSDVSNFDIRGNRVVYEEYQWKNFMKDPFKPAICLYDFATGEKKELLAQGKMSGYRLSFWKDDEILFVGAENELSDGEGEPTDFYVLDLKSCQCKKFAEQGRALGLNTVCTDARYGSGQTSKLAEDGSYYFLLTLCEGTYINHIDSDGKITYRLNSSEDDKSAVDSFDICKGHIIANKMEPGRLAELFYDGQKVTDFNREFAAEYNIIKPEYHSFIASDGFEVHGYGMKPAGWWPGRKYPAILHIHGGPLGAFGEVYHHEMQMWANAGYYVIYCNPRGSDGRGAEYYDINGKWGTVDYQNIMDFLDEMLKCYPDIDEKRLAVCGGSYGGFMTNWIIGHTHRFAAAVAQRSISHLIGFEYSSDIGLLCTATEHGATTETNPEALWEQSPLKYAPNCTTPTLFIQSDEDYRCYMTDAIAMFNALKKHGCPARMCLFHGENHELSRSGKPQNRIARMKEILSWMDLYLK